MAFQGSIYLSGATEKAMRERAREEESLSAVLKTTAERGLAVLAHELRGLANQFSEAEWLVILDSFNGTLTYPELINDIAINIEDNIALNDAGARFGLNAEEAAKLPGKIQSLSPGASWAVLDAAERFWSATARGEEINADAAGLRKLGVVVRSN